MPAWSEVTWTYVTWHEEGENSLSAIVTGIVPLVRSGESVAGHGLVSLDECPDLCGMMCDLCRTFCKQTMIATTVLL